MNAAALRARIEAAEGRRHVVYRDSRGIPTIGVGLNLTRWDAHDLLRSVDADYMRARAGEPLTDWQIDGLLDSCIRDAITGARAILMDEWDGLPEAVQHIVVELIFNLGARRLQGFRKFLAAVRAHDWMRAASELIDSRWHEQVGERAGRIVLELRALAVEAQ